ncbi:MAG: hypothetical protein J0I99_07520 [Devosia sp.]|uniref:hypothetical protein n=1 Tax=Devosia sp. TaxID=1871048 RepID=UPI001ACF86CD|nr:hypothetical protein [Devosia sp.]MBN9315568.1 hypothetical protein [Devosia sp.]
MKSILSALALVAAMGVAGGASAEDAMAPMQDNAMSGGAMSSDAMMMTPDQMMAMCLEKAATATDATTKTEDEKACHTVHNLLMGDDMMSGDAMSGGAMAPAAQ